MSTETQSPAETAHYPEIIDIRNDLDSLKTNVYELTMHLKRDGQAQTQEVSEYLAKSISEWQEKGEKKLRDVERKVKSHPTESLALAFGAGLIASLLLGRRH